METASVDPKSYAESQSAADTGDSAAAETRTLGLTKDEGYTPQWDRLTRLMVTVFMILAIVYAFSLILPVLPVLVIAALIGFILFFPVRALTRRTRLTWSVSVLVVYFLLVFVIILAAIGLVPVLVEGIQAVADGFQSFIAELQTALEDYQPQDGVIVILGVQIDADPVISPVRSVLLEAIPPELSDSDELQPGTEADGGATSGETSGETTSDASPEEISLSAVDTQAAALSIDIRSIITQAFGVLGTVAGALGSVTSVIANLFLAVFISFLGILDLPRANRAIGNWIPANYHREAALIMEQLEQIWTRFFAGQFVIGIVIGILTYVQLSLMGVQSALVLAVLVGVLSLLPTIGGFLALIPLFLVPLFQGSLVFTEMSNLTFALLVVGVNLAITQIIWTIVAPKVLGDALRLPVVVIIIGIFVGAAVGGLLGAFLATPVISTLWLFFNYLLRKIAQKDPFPGKEPRIVFGQSKFAQTASPANR